MCSLSQSLWHYCTIGTTTEVVERHKNMANVKLTAKFENFFVLLFYRDLFEHYRDLFEHYGDLFEHYRDLVEHYRDLFELWILDLI